MLYNEFVPALEPEKHNWKYRAYGHYDGIGIGKKIEFQNGSSFEKYIRAAQKATVRICHMQRRPCLDF